MPSLDTDTCDHETRRGNVEASEISEDVVMYVISADFPFAQTPHGISPIHSHLYPRTAYGCAARKNLAILSDRNQFARLHPLVIAVEPDPQDANKSLIVDSLQMFGQTFRLK